MDSENEFKAFDASSLREQDISSLKEALETIKEQNNFLNAIFESEPECVKVVALNGELNLMNRAVPVAAITEIVIATLPRDIFTEFSAFAGLFIFLN